ncbi:MAG: hypothetical protein ACOYB0_11000, partial [Polynucleobacter sp.]
IDFEKKYMTNVEAIALLVMERDLCQTIKQIATVIQLTVTKYAQVLLAAAKGFTSPYALTIKEVENLSAILYQSKGLQLDTDLNNIKSTAVIDNNKLVLVFSIPVKSEMRAYNFYKPTAIPIFKDGKVLMPQLDEQFVAISKSGSKYLTMSIEEFQQCKMYPNECLVHRPARPLTDKSSCTIMTYAEDRLKCPVIEMQDSPAFFYIDGYRLIYSVNGTMRLYIKCQEHRHSTQYKDSTIEITDQGEVTLRSSCAITIPDGSTFETPAANEILNLQELPIYDTLTTFPNPSEYQVLKTEAQQQPIFDTSMFVTLDQINVDEGFPNFMQVVEDALKPRQSLRFILSVSFLIIMIVLTIIIIWMCRYKGLACLRIMHIIHKSKNDDKEGPIDIQEKAMKEKIQKIGDDFNELQFKLYKSTHKHQPRSMNSSESGDIEMRSEELPEEQKVWFRREQNASLPKYAKYPRPNQYPSILKKHLSAADAAYRVEKGEL